MRAITLWPLGAYCGGEHQHTLLDMIISSIEVHKILSIIGADGACPDLLTVETGTRQDGVLNITNTVMKIGNPGHGDKYLEKTLHKFLRPVLDNDFR